MAKSNILDMILKTVNDVQRKNKVNPNEETADPSVFGLIKDKLRQLDQKQREKRVARGKSPISVMDRIRKEIEGARRENKKDPNVNTAPKSVFDQIFKKMEANPKRQASAGLRKIVQDYNLDVSNLPREVLGQIQERYVADRKKFDHQYAQAIHDLIKQKR
jgi:non-homologous end joining protein Ku